MRTHTLTDPSLVSWLSLVTAWVHSDLCLVAAVELSREVFSWHVQLSYMLCTLYFSVLGVWQGASLPL